MSLQMCTSVTKHSLKQRVCVSSHKFNRNTINNCIQLKLRDFLMKIGSLPNEIKMCRICTLNINYVRVDMINIHK